MSLARWREAPWRGIKIKVKRRQAHSSGGEGEGAGQAVLERLIQAARELFVAQGVEAVTVRSIARKAGCSIGLLYHYVDGKEDLLARILASAFARLLERLRRQEQSHHDPMQRLRAVLEAYARFAIEHPHDYRLLFAAGPPGAHPHLRHVFHTLGTGCYHVIRDSCAGCIRDGRFREGLEDADVAAQVLWAGIHGMVHLLDAAEGFPFHPRRALLRRHLETLLAGVGRA